MASRGKGPLQSFFDFTSEILLHCSGSSSSLRHDLLLHSQSPQSSQVMYQNLMQEAGLERYEFLAYFVTHPNETLRTEACDAVHCASFLLPSVPSNHIISACQSQACGKVLYSACTRASRTNSCRRGEVQVRCINRCFLLVIKTL